MVPTPYSGFQLSEHRLRGLSQQQRIHARDDQRIVSREVRVEGSGRDPEDAERDTGSLTHVCPSKTGIKEELLCHAPFYISECRQTNRTRAHPQTTKSVAVVSMHGYKG